MTREQLVAHLTEPSNLVDHLEMIAKHLKTLDMNNTSSVQEEFANYKISQPVC